MVSRHSRLLSTKRKIHTVERIRKKASKPKTHDLSIPGKKKISSVCEQLRVPELLPLGITQVARVSRLLAILM